MGLPYVPYPHAVEWSVGGLKCCGVFLQVRENLVNGLEELLNVDGLGDVAIHACSEAALAVAFHGMRCQSNDGSVPRRSLFAHPNHRSRHEAVHLWHLNIHK